MWFGGEAAYIHMNFKLVACKMIFELLNDMIFVTFDLQLGAFFFLSKSSKGASDTKSLPGKLNPPLTPLNSYM